VREGLTAALEAALADGDVRAVVLAGAGGVFCAGGDVSLPLVGDPAEGRARMQGHQRIVRLLAEAEKPLVAAVEGWASGGGAGIGLLCDTIVAGTSARLGFPFLRGGLVPDYALALTLARRVGAGRARQLLLYGRSVDGARALELGLVDEVVDDELVQATAVERARELAAQPPHALALTKRLLARGTPLEGVLELELMAQSLSYLSPERAEGRAAFLEKRTPTF
jgi:enoyl-CoA hydratase/carnithine racemase